MKIRNGPATVSGDEHHKIPLGNWEGVISRVIRKSGDLFEEQQQVAFPVIKAVFLFLGVSLVFFEIVGIAGQETKIVKSIFN